MPQLIDIFNNKPFRAVELTTAMEQVAYVPTLLGSMGEALFRTVRVRNRQIAIFKRMQIMRLVPVSPIGAPPVQLEKQPGEMRNFHTRRLAKSTTIYAEELQGLLTMPDFQATQTVQGELAQRATMIRDDLELTAEYQRLGAVQGMVVDADGTTVLDNWFTNWGVAQPAAFNFHFDVDTSNIRGISDSVITAAWQASNGAWIDGQTEIHALCGPNFFTDLVGHPMVERTYLNYAAAAELRGSIADTFTFGGIVWHRYRGTPTGDFSIPTNECRFFPMGTNGDVFQRVMGPAEFDPFINQPGQDVYALTIPDRDRGAFVATELYNYPLFVCLRPEMLQRGIAS